MDKCTHEVRAQYWRNIIQSCQQRPAGQSAKKWMDDNGINEQSYYSWQRRFRQEAYQQMTSESSAVPAVRENSEVTFSEIPWKPEQLTASKENFVGCTPAAVLKTSTLTIAITNEISDSLLSRIIKEVSHA